MPAAARRPGLRLLRSRPLEHGQGRPRWRTFRKLADALGVEPSALAPEPDAGATGSGDAHQG